MNYLDLVMMVLDVVVTSNASISIAFTAVLIVIACTLRK